MARKHGTKGEAFWEDERDSIEIFLATRSVPCLIYYAHTPLKYRMNGCICS